MGLLLYGQLTGLDHIHAYIAETGINLLPQKSRRHGMDIVDSLRVLCR